MRYLKTFEGVIDDLNKKARDEKSEAGEELTLSDITAGYDIYCGNHTNADDETEICGYLFGERNPGPAANFVKTILKRKCPDCGMEIGNRVMYVDNVNDYEEKLPGVGFYINPKSLDLESKETTENTPKQSGSEESVVKSNFDICFYLDKYINVLLAAYVAITPQKHKVKINEVTVRKALEKLRRECKYKDDKRSEAAIKEFNMFMDPMIADAVEKNIPTWRLGSNGKKYYGVFKEFTDQIKR